MHAAVVQSSGPAQVLGRRLQLRRGGKSASSACYLAVEAVERPDDAEGGAVEELPARLEREEERARARERLMGPGWSKFTNSAQIHKFSAKSVQT